MKKVDRPNIVLIVADSMRARNVSCYGYPHSTTPNLDRLAAGGIRFTNAFTVAPFTVASTASILTGVYPSVHRLEHYGQRLSEGLVTLPQLLRDAGYYTAGFIANPHVNPASGLTCGFSFYTDGRPWYKQPQLLRHFVNWSEGGGNINRAVKEQLSRNKERPFFFLIFYNDSHLPFSALPRIFLPLTGRKFHSPDFESATYTQEELARVVDLYDKSLRRADHHLGRVVQMIQAAERTDDTLFLVTGDHGEGLDTRPERAGHGRLYDNGIHVPLVAAGKPLPRRGAVVDNLVISLDLAPTISEVAGLDIPDQFQGQSLVPFLREGQPPTLRMETISEYHDARCVRTPDWKLIDRAAGIGAISTGNGGQPELYFLPDDPLEEVNVASQYPTVLAELSQRLSQFEAELSRDGYDPSDFDMDESFLERLRGLGYLN